MPQEFEAFLNEETLGAVDMKVFVLEDLGNLIQVLLVFWTGLGEDKHVIKVNKDKAEDSKQGAHQALESRGLERLNGVMKAVLRI